jgi:hypothetical protein
VIVCDLDLGELQAIEPPRVLVGIEQRDGPTGMGHDNARGSLPAPTGNQLTRALIPG